MLRHIDGRRFQSATALAVERHARQKGFQRGGLLRQSLEPVPLMARPDVLRGAERLHLRRRHQAGVVVLVALERQANALDGVGDETHRAVVIDGLERLEHARHVVAAEVRHQRQQFVIAAAIDQRRHVALIADLVLQALAECRAALETQRRVHLVRTGIDPAPQGLATGLGKRRLHQATVFHDHHVPPEIAEHGFELLPETFAHHGIEALAVVVDDPPGVAQAVLPAFE